MAEKLDLGRLAKLAGVHRKEGTPFVSVTPNEIDSLIARIRALESRASNAGGVHPDHLELLKPFMSERDGRLSHSLTVYLREMADPEFAERMHKARVRLYTATNAGGAVWIQRDHLEKAKTGAYLCRVEAEYRDGMGFVPLYPAPASKEPVADERCNRCGHENHSGSCVNVHPDKTPIKQESTLDGLRDCLQKMVDANLEDSLGPNHLALCLKQMAYEALELIQKVQPVADELAAWQEGYKAGIEKGRKDPVMHEAKYVEGYRAALATAQTVPDGWLLVPVEPTDAMLDATRGKGCSPGSWNNWAKKRHATIYRQMLAAAPAKPEGV